MIYALIFAALLSTSVAITKDPKECADQNRRCLFWAKEHDQCSQNADWMKANCPASCGECKGEKKVVIESCCDEDPECEAFKKSGECEKNAHYMLWKCAKVCGFCDKPGVHPYPAALAELCNKEGKKEERNKSKSNSRSKERGGRNHGRASKSSEHSQSTQGPTPLQSEAPLPATTGTPPSVVSKLVPTAPQPSLIPVAQSSLPPIIQLPAVAGTTEGWSGAFSKDCTDKHILCAYWQSIGECSNNTAYMSTSCAASCGSCSPKRVHRHGPCIDQDPNCAAFGQNGECTKDSRFYMFWKCPQTCKWCENAVAEYPAGIFQSAANGTQAPMLKH